MKLRKSKPRQGTSQRKKARTNEKIDDLSKNFSIIETKLSKHHKSLQNLQIQNNLLANDRDLRMNDSKTSHNQRNNTQSKKIGQHSSSLSQRHDMMNIGNIKFNGIKTEVPLESAETNHQYNDVNNGESLIQPIADVGTDNEKTKRRLIKSSTKSQMHKMSRSHNIEEYNVSSSSPSLTVLPCIENDEVSQHEVFVSRDDTKQEQISGNQEINQLHDINTFDNIENHQNTQNEVFSKDDDTKQDHISDIQKCKQIYDTTTVGIINSSAPTVLPNIEDHENVQTEVFSSTNSNQEPYLTEIPESCKFGKIKTINELENKNILDQELSTDLSKDSKAFQICKQSNKLSVSVESIIDNVTLKDSCHNVSKLKNSFIKPTSLNQETGLAGGSFNIGIDLEEDHIDHQEKETQIEGTSLSTGQIILPELNTTSREVKNEHHLNSNKKSEHISSTDLSSPPSATYFEHMLEYAKPNNKKSNLSLQEKLLAVEALNISFEADFENTSKTFQTFDKLSETESEFPADFPSESVNKNNIMLETIVECSSSEKS